EGTTRSDPRPDPPGYRSPLAPGARWGHTASVQPQRRVYTDGHDEEGVQSSEEWTERRHDLGEGPTGIEVRHHCDRRGDGPGQLEREPEKTGDAAADRHRAQESADPALPGKFVIQIRCRIESFIGEGESVRRRSPRAHDLVAASGLYQRRVPAHQDLGITCIHRTSSFPAISAMQPDHE